MEPSLTAVHRKFITEPIGDKPVTALAGIGPVLGGHLAMKGFPKASMVLGQFLVLGKNEQAFKTWLMSTAGGYAGQWDACYKCLLDYCNNFLF